MIFAAPYLSDPNCHFNMNIVDNLYRPGDLILDVAVKSDFVAKILTYLSDKSLENEMVIYNPYEKEDFVVPLKRKIPELRIVMFCSDDEWRCFNYDRYLALYVDYFCITAREHKLLYNSWGFANVIVTMWACNTNKFHPIDVKKKYDVSFIGSPYGERVNLVRELLNNGVPLKVFGSGWGRYRDVRPYWGGRLSLPDMVRVISETKVNLNFTWASRGDGHQIKGRTFEISGCQAFQLCNDSEALRDYFVPGKELGTFTCHEECTDSINYYLRNEEAREQMALRAYEKVLSLHTWESRFKEIFDFCNNNTGPNIKLPRFSILVIEESNDVSHQIKSDDRLKVTFSNRYVEGGDFDGIIHVPLNSSINNDTLYLMAFALYADKSAMVVSDFSLGNTWIRIKSKDLQSRKSLLALIPANAIMLSARACSESKGSISFIEYPTFTVFGHSLWKSLWLRLLFSSYDQRKMFYQYKSDRQLIKMLVIACEYIVRKLVFGKLTSG